MPGNKKFILILLFLFPALCGFSQNLDSLILEGADSQKLLSELLSIKNNTQKPEEKLQVLLKLSYLEEILGDLENAQKHYQEAAFLFVNSQSHTALLKSALLLFELGEYGASLEQVKIVKELSKDQGEREIADLLIIKNLSAESRTEEAVKLYLSIIQDLESINNLPFLLGLYELAVLFKNGECEQKIGKQINNRYSESLEAMLMKQRISIYPSFYTYFLNDPKINKDNLQKEKIVVIQIGSFQDRENALYRKIDAERAGFIAEIKEVKIEGKTYFRLVISADDGNLEEKLRLLKEKGFEGHPVY